MEVAVMATSILIVWQRSEAAVVAAVAVEGGRAVVRHVHFFGNRGLYYEKIT